MKFIEIWILNSLKTSSRQLVALKSFGIWLGGYFSTWVLKSEQQNAIDHVCAFGDLTTLFVDGFGFEHDLDAL